MADRPRYALVETAHGNAAIGWTAQGICSFRLPAPTAEASRRAIVRALPDAVECAPPENVAQVVAATQRYFRGERVDFVDVPLDLGRPDDFVAEIYGFIRSLGWGETTTYGGVARALGRGPAAARAVGQAMARNPVPLILPCHRVLAAGDRIGGFTAPGGSDAKARMLALEGMVPVSPPAPVPTAQTSFAF